MSTEETQAILSGGEATPQEEAETREETPSEIIQRKDGKGKLPPIPKNKAIDSTNAAGDVLKQFFNRR